MRCLLRPCPGKYTRVTTKTERQIERDKVRLAGKKGGIRRARVLVDHTSATGRCIITRGRGIQLEVARPQPLAEHNVGIERRFVHGFTAQNEFRHEGDVDDGQTERFDARQFLLVGKDRHDFAQLIEGFVQTEHTLTFADVGGTALSDTSRSTPFRLTLAGTIDALPRWIR